MSTNDRSTVAASQLAKHVPALVKDSNDHHTQIGFEVEDEVRKLRDASVEKAGNVEMLRKGG